MYIMGKKCVPGLFCIENMTLFLLVLLTGGILYYLYFIAPRASVSTQTAQPTKIILAPVNMGHSLENPYVPPYKDEIPTMLGLGEQPAVPVNIRTRGIDTNYRQIGILTKNAKGGGEPVILPLMGRNMYTGRDKWQYYTMSNTSGTMSTRLPVSVNGKSCSGEYGCDSIYNGDTVYVEGYNDTFSATIYENGRFSYMP